jgi:hypothetical protein
MGRFKNGRIDAKKSVIMSLLSNESRLRLTPLKFASSDACYFAVNCS